VSVRILQGDCREVMATLAENSVDAIVCDPPYELGFMGKGWDRTGVANDVETWRQALRVLKPGGHLLAFGGTRTYHRMVCAIEDAGFEVRDQIGWVYGSGFPKSLDVSKAIDRLDAADTRRERQLRFTAWLRGTGITQARVDQLTSTNMGGHYLTAASQPAVATREHFEKLRPHLGGGVPEWVEQMVDERTVESENFKARELLATEERYNEPSGIVSAGRDERTLIERRITAAHTDAARQWEGWGTALKPAWEPIVMARKPLAGTVAANVLAHGTGALNIDGCRVPTDESLNGGAYSAERQESASQWAHKGSTIHNSTGTEFVQPTGRWPANIIHDGSDEVLAAFPQSSSGIGYGSNAKGQEECPAPRGAETGSAARFFYCAKASKRDRGEGNTHPTVKPTDLMRYLCRLVTPPGGLVLDPFAGSGSTLKAAELEGFDAIGIDEATRLAVLLGRLAPRHGAASPARSRPAASGTR
jgi:DNA modification methylase